MKKITLLFFLFILAYACSSSKKAPSPIGLVTLRNYAINDNLNFSDEVNFKIFTNSADFLTTFHMTKSTPATVVIPDFNGQSVVAVILKPTTKVQSVSIDNAEISNADLNIYYSIVDTTSWSTFKHIEAVAATVPKSLDVKQVNFYNRNIKEKTLPVVH